VAFLASTAYFVLAAAATPIRGHTVVVVILGCGYVAIALVAAKRWGSLYGVPLVIAAGLALDSFYIPPTRSFGADVWQNWLVIAIYIALGVVIGMFASETQRRAEASERARGRLAEEQAALRRVATLVAREASPTEVFTAVAEEMGMLLGVENAWMHRFEPDGAAAVVGSWGRHEAVPAGDDSEVATPIVVDGHVWGEMIAASRRDARLPADTQARMGEFTELVATAISNVQARSDLAASRARLVAAADDERRRVVRDLHDGAQQRLIHTVVTLKLAARALENEHEAAPELVAEALDNAQRATVELRELAHGILPAVLTRGGLRAAVDALASRMSVPVEVSVTVGRLPPTVEATAYFVVAEALTNVVKHSGATRAAVTAHVDGNTLNLDVRDDGVGGARPDGSGLLGLVDRLAVLNGRLRVDSPLSGGTVITAAVPVPSNGA
jgi:signal transduction histidine kinase